MVVFSLSILLSFSVSSFCEYLSIIYFVLFFYNMYCFSICISSVSLSVCSSVTPSGCLSDLPGLPVRLTVCMYVWLSNWRSLRLSDSFYSYYPVCLIVYLIVRLSVCMSD